MIHEENKTYEFIPADGDYAWNIRILEGMYNETVVQYGAISVGDETKDGSGDHVLNFNFEIISSPDPDLSPDDVELQHVVGDILLEIIKTSIERNDGSMAIKDVDDEDAEWEILE